MNFWENVKSELNFQGKTQKELAASCNINYASLQTRIYKNSIPGIYEAYLIAQFLNVSIEYLITGNNIPGLNDDEMEVIRLYKTLTDENKSMIKMVLSSVSVK